MKTFDGFEIWQMRQKSRKGDGYVCQNIVLTLLTAPVSSIMQQNAILVANDHVSHFFS